jgi:glycosyltransferase involved in cell wall biosynthesis
MRFIFHNPHARISFGQTLIDFLLRNNMPRKANKYQYLLDYLVNNKQPIFIYLDYQDSSLPVWLQRRFFIRIEIYLWTLLKGFSLSQVQILDKPSMIEPDDIFFSFLLKNIDTEYHGIDWLSEHNCIKMFHFTHYVQNTSLVSKNFERLWIDFILAENNLQNVEYFKHFFPSYPKQVYTLPFSFNTKKFIRKASFSDRRNICLATGAVINIDDYPWLFDDFSWFYRAKTMQPLRKEILDSVASYSNLLETTSVNFAPTDVIIRSPLQKFFSWISKLIFWAKRTYFNFDIVQRYNQYKMFVCGEEINWLPGIWFVEWMACGCAYIGKRDSMYTDLWLIPWVHYIAHDGSLEDIVDKICYYQEHQQELEEIAQNWYNFVTNNFSGQKVAATFYNDILSLGQQHKDNNYSKNGLEFNCSFRA